MRTVDNTFGSGRLQVGTAETRGNQGTIHVVDKVSSPVLPHRKGNPSVVVKGGPVAISCVEGGAVASDAPKTMVELLLRAADQHGDHAIVHVDADGVERSQTYRDLVADACRVAHGLSLLGLARGATVLLQLGASHQFFTGLWGCLVGGYVPALVAVPADYVEGIPGSSKVETAWRTLHRPPILTTVAQQAALREFANAHGWDGLRIACLEDLLTDGTAQPYRLGSPDDPALMLFTSGSTGMPEVVVQRHRAIVSQVLGSARQLSMDSTDMVLNWMPLDHVASVVMLHSVGLYAGCRQACPDALRPG